jgi:hypothetical protein
MSDTERQAAEDARKRLDDVVWAFTLVRRRYPLLVQTAEEMEVLRRHFTRNFYNDGVLQVLRDSFDMLVIDLFSIREAIVESDGLIARLRQLPGFLRPAVDGEEWTAPIPPKDRGAKPENRDARRDAFFERHFIKGLNDAVERLAPHGAAASPDAAKSLIKRFRTETAALDDDRNRVRAHRYEKTSKETNHLFIPLPDLAAQMETMERYISELYFVSTGNNFHMSTTFSYSDDETARDLADLIVLGSINRATQDFGLAANRREPGARSWYWKRRADFLEVPAGGDADGKRLTALTEMDFKSHPIWKYHSQSHGADAWLQPCIGLAALERRSGDQYLVATRFTFSDGSTVGGFCSPVTSTELDSLQPAVFGRLGQVRIWQLGDRSRPDIELGNRLQKSHEGIFPIQFASDVIVGENRVSGILGLGGTPPNPALKLTVTSLPSVAP